MHTRRDFFNWATHGIGGAALASLLTQDGTAKATSLGEARDRLPALRPQGPPRDSHLPVRRHEPGRFVRLQARARFACTASRCSRDEKPDVFFGQVGLLRKTDWEFQQRGQSGLWVSELFPHIAGVADELTVIHSMVAETSNHTPATFQENSGFRLNGFPALGSWLSYGLGSETDNLPAFVVIPDARGLPAGGSINWSNGFLPARHQGVVIRSTGHADRRPVPGPRGPGRQPNGPRATCSPRMNRRHLEDRGGDDALSARIRSYELAARMQLAVPRSDRRSTAKPRPRSRSTGSIATETADFGRGCLLARRLLERGVRFVQLFSGGSFGSPRINWDGHENMKAQPRPGSAAHRSARRRPAPRPAPPRHARRHAGAVHHRVRPHAVHAVGRRTWSARAAITTNTASPSGWPAPACKHGIAYGATDEIGWKAVENPVTWHDFHATVLHLLGIDHERLTYYHNGIRRRLTNVHGQVIDDILA